MNTVGALVLPSQCLFGPLLNHLVGGRQQRFRDSKAERLGRLEVDDEFEFCGLLDGQISWFVALEDAPGIDANLVGLIAEAAAIAHQAAGQSVFTEWEDRG